MKSVLSHLLLAGAVCLFSFFSWAGNKCNDKLTKIVSNPYQNTGIFGNLDGKGNLPVASKGLRAAVTKRSADVKSYENILEWIYESKDPYRVPDWSHGQLSEIMSDYANAKIDSSQRDHKIEVWTKIRVGNYVRNATELSRYFSVPREKRESLEASENLIVQKLVDPKIPLNLRFKGLLSAYEGAPSKNLVRAIGWTISSAPKANQLKMLNDFLGASMKSAEFWEIQYEKVAKGWSDGEYLRTARAEFQKKIVAERDLEQVVELLTTISGRELVDFVYNAISTRVLNLLSFEKEYWKDIRGLYAHYIESALQAVREDFSARNNSPFKRTALMKLINKDSRNVALAFYKISESIHAATKGDLESGEFENLIAGLSQGAPKDHVFFSKMVERQVREPIADALLKEGLAEQEAVLELSDRNPSFNDWAAQVLERGEY